MPDKIIFLDFDGPMIPGRAHFLPLIHGHRSFDPVAVTLVNRLAEKAKAKIVIHSNWRKGYYKGDLPLRDWIISNGLKEEHFHKDFFCPMRMSSERYQDIGMWLDDHPDTKDFVILEDLPLFMGYERFIPNFVKIDYMEGLTWERYETALTIFGEKEIILE